ncbi:MAG: transporter substrate-binding domain-containing protein [Pseudomonadota bacterium]
MMSLEPQPSWSARATRQTLALAVALCAACTGAHADATLDKIHQRHKVVIGVTTQGGPFGSIDPATQQLIGWNPELARDLARRLGAEAELVQVQPTNRIQFLQSGRVDLLIASMDYNTERGEILGHVPTPFYLVGGTAIMLKTATIKHWEDLRGKAVCTSQGGSYAKVLQAQYGAEIRGFKSSAESLLALRGSNCVAAVHDTTVLYPMLRSNPEWAAYAAPIEAPLAPAPSVVWTRKGEADTQAAIDKVVRDWHRSGWLIDTEKRLGITPPNPFLVEQQAKIKTAS